MYLSHGVGSASLALSGRKPALGPYNGTGDSGYQPLRGVLANRVVTVDSAIAGRKERLVTVAAVEGLCLLSMSTLASIGDLYLFGRPLLLHLLQAPAPASCGCGHMTNSRPVPERARGVDDGARDD